MIKPTADEVPMITARLRSIAHVKVCPPVLESFAEKSTATIQE
jgi:hypothetical protein